MPISENAKYYPLYKFLRNKKNKMLVLEWAKIEKILGFNLPKSALTKTWYLDMFPGGSGELQDYETGETYQVEMD